MQASSALTIIDSNLDYAGPEVELSIIMPCLNEIETIATCVKKAQEFLLRSGISGEVVIGDNGSTDGSQAVALELGARVIDVPMKGYGAALYGATQACRGKYCIMGDSDDSYDFLHLDEFVSHLRAGDDLVMGNRFKGGIKQGAMPWKNRYIGNPILSAIGNVLFRSPVTDFHCGLRGYSKEAFRKMDLRTTGMEFASEMVIKATLMKLRLSEVPTTLSPDGRSRPPHLRPYRDGWRHLRFMLLFSPNWLFLYPGIAIVAVSAALGLLLLFGPITVDGVRLGIDTLIYCGFLIVAGFQAIFFSALSRAYAVQEGLYPSRASHSETRPRARRSGRLEIGLLIGLALLLTGIAYAATALLSWRNHNFGLMDTETIVRIVIPSSVGMTLGLEVILCSLLLSTLELGVRHHSTHRLKEHKLG